MQTFRRHGLLWALLGPVALGGAIEAQERPAEAGRLVGRVVDESTGRPLPSAQVFLEDGSVGSLTAVDGRYVLRDVPIGVHTVVVQSLGYGSKTVTGVEVTAGVTSSLDVGLSPQAVAVEGITVSAAAERGSTTSLLTERRAAAVVSDAIGADQIARSPDGDAASALKRVPGLSVVDGKFAYVRGLGDRYSATTLNGSSLASPIPDKKVIPLDVIPSGLLESIVTSKSYSPDQPGDYAGGLVQLRTRAFPANRILSVSASAGWDSNASFKDGLGYSGGGLDFLGFDDGTRDLPGLIRHDVAVTRSNFSSEELQEIGRSFGGDWGPTREDVPLNGSLSLSFGDDYDVFGDQRFGFIASGNYSASQSVRTDIIERVFATSGAADPEVDYRGEITEQSVSVGGLLNMTYQPRTTDQITLSTLYNRLTDDLARSLEGFNLDSNTDQLNTRLQYLAQSLFNTQLRGEHTLGALNDAAFDWRGAYTRASRYEPNTREVLYREFDGRFVFDDFIQSGSIFHQDMVDEGWSAAANLKVPSTSGGSRRSCRSARRPTGRIATPSPGASGSDPFPVATSTTRRACCRRTSCSHPITSRRPVSRCRRRRSARTTTTRSRTSTPPS